MGGKFDRKALLAKGVQQEDASLDKRFKLADQIMGGGVPPQDDQGDQTTGAIFKVPLSKLRNNPYNARQIYLPEQIAARAASLKADGQRSPIEVVEDPDNPGGYIHITGHYRKYGALQIGWDSLDAILREAKTPKELYRLSYIENNQRSDHSALDDALAWQILLEDKVVEKEEDLVTLTGLSWSKVNKTLALLKLPESIQRMIRDHSSIFGAKMGYEVFLYFSAAGEDETVNLINRILNDELSYRQVEEFRKTLAASKATVSKLRKKKEVFRPYKIRIDGQEAGVLKESADSGKVELSVVINDSQARNELMTLLKRRFGLDCE